MFGFREDNWILRSAFCIQSVLCYLRHLVEVFEENRASHTYVVGKEMTGSPWGPHTKGWGTMILLYKLPSFYHQWYSV